MWGRLLDRFHADSISRRFSSSELVHCDDANWSWPGFGGAQPRQLPALTGVQDLALGGWHALALVK